MELVDPDCEELLVVSLEVSLYVSEMSERWFSVVVAMTLSIRLCMLLISRYKFVKCLLALLSILSEGFFELASSLLMRFAKESFVCQIVVP